MKRAIITGSASGIGQAIAERCDQLGYYVGVFDRDRQGAQALRRKLQNAQAFEVDVTKPTEVQEAFTEFGPCDLLVNNAGIVRFAPLLELDLENWRHVIDVNLNAYFYCAQACAKQMIKTQGGVIINITSINGVLPAPYAGAYGTAKAAVALLTQQMALEWGPHRIRVNAVAPGLIDGGMSQPIYADAKFRHLRESKVPIGRLGRVEDIAKVVTFLASDEAEYITGEEIIVDGGVSLGMMAQLPRPPKVDGQGIVVK